MRLPDPDFKIGHIFEKLKVNSTRSIQNLSHLNCARFHEKKRNFIPKKLFFKSDESSGFWRNKVTKV